MTVAGGTQALVATFAFGLVALASSALAILLSFGSRHLRGSVPFRNGLRLVLLIFLSSLTLWSILGFSATLVSGNGNPSCQVLIVFATGFDQLARVAFEQFLAWRIKPKQLSPVVFGLQGLLLVRFIIGAVLVGVQRPQVYPVCIAKNILPPLGIATTVVDALIVCIIFTLIRISKSSNIPLITKRAASGLTSTQVTVFLTAGFAAWLATSIPILVGSDMFPIATRTAVPAVGLLLVLGLIVLFRNQIIIADPDTQPSSYPSKPNLSKALPSRPIESRDRDASAEVFNQPWGGPRLHISQLQRSGTEPLPMPKPGSRGAGSALPIINRPVPGQSERGVGGVPVEGQLFPPIRPNTAPTSRQLPSKRPLRTDTFNISRPVIHEGSDQKIKDKIPTVDLATALRNDQERRAMMINGSNQSRSHERSLSVQQSSLKGKQVASMITIPVVSSERSYLSPNAATTAAQLSPGIDELRRRSPRSVSNAPESVMSPPRSSKRLSVSVYNQTYRDAPLPAAPSPLRKSHAGNPALGDISDVFIDPSPGPAIPLPHKQEDSTWPSIKAAASPLVPRVLPLPMPFPKARSDAMLAKPYENPAAVTARESIFARSVTGSVRRDIRPSRQRPSSPKTEQIAAPAKTPVQLRTFNGIPLNPKAQQANGPSTETTERGHTVMFVNKAAGNETTESDVMVEPVSRQVFALELANSSPSTDSIVHRPRPIPRKSSIYKADFTVKFSPTVYRHRLSRSGGSIELQRESLDSLPEPISRIPSFPAPPRSAGAILALSSYQKFSEDTVRVTTPGSIQPTSTRVSSFADPAPFINAGTDPKTTTSESTEFGDRKSVEAGFVYNPRRQSSPVLPVDEMRHVSMANLGRPFLDDKVLVSPPSSARSGTSTISQHNSDEGEEIVPLILDTEPEGPFSAGSSRRSSAMLSVGWHRRVGDACPSFSHRKNGSKSPRRVLPPTPLLLGTSTRQARIVETEPSPLESPQHALDVIQQQLRRLDEADSETRVEDKQRLMLLDNIEAEMGAQETHWQDIRRNLAGRSPSSTRSSISLLLAGGDSNLTSPRPSPALRSHDLGLAGTDRGAGPASGMKTRTSSNKTPADEKSAPPPSELTDAHGRSTFVFTDVGSAQADVGEVENRARFGKSVSQTKDGGLLLSAISNSTSSAHRQLAHHLGSPTPPDTDDESDDEIDDYVQFESAALHTINSSAWAQPVSIYLASVEKAPLPVSHWSIDSDTTALVSETLFQQSKDVSQSSDIASAHLSTTPAPAPESGGLISLGGADKQTGSPVSLPRESLISPPVPAENRQSPGRPVTQKPPRRSRRITLLPDIPESPKPLKNKRNTLGVFQFPWGEISDIATLQPHHHQSSHPPPVPLPVATLNELSAASQGPILASQIYPASFFDHYTEDADQDEFTGAPAPDSDGSTGGYYSDEEDEAFDETTLWEIANLLRTSEVPSRHSLFPVSEDYPSPSRNSFTADEAHHLPPTTDLDESTLVLKDKPLPSLPLPQTVPTIWKSSKMMYTRVARSAGLAQPDEKTWNRYLGTQQDTQRAAPRRSEPDRITSTSLWSPQPKKVDLPVDPSAYGLWQPTQKVPTTPASSKTPLVLASPSSLAESCSSVLTTPSTTAGVIAHKVHGLWSPRTPVVRVFLGLPQDEEEWSRYSSSTTAESSRPKPRPSKQDSIESTTLWTDSTKSASSPSHLSHVIPSKPVSITPSSFSTVLPLWSKPAALPTEQTDGLWSTTHIRHTYRTTDEYPAALDTTRKPRSSDHYPLATLHSASLWSTTTQTPPRQVPDWLTLSTTLRPVSPGGSSTVSDQDYASAFDTSSLRSEVTAASSVATTSKHSHHRRTSSSNKQAAQEALGGTFTDAIQSKAVHVIHEEPEETRLFFDVTKAHPVFAVDVLQITSDNVHPAATGYLHSIINGAPRPRRH